MTFVNLACAGMLICLLVSCKKQEERIPDLNYNPEILAANFSKSTELTNPYFNFEPGKKYIYEGQTEEGLERIEVERLGATRTVMGITCVVVRDRVWINGILHEDTDDWYAQDNAGNVWYFGEEVDNFDTKGQLTNHHGSWEAGVDGAKPGIAMPTNPKPGMKYRQEYYFNEAEDEAEVLQIGLTINIPLGSYSNCIQTKDFTALEPDLIEHKFYAPGIGLIKEMNPTDKEEMVLIKIE